MDKAPDPELRGSDFYDESEPEIKAKITFKFWLFDLLAKIFKK